MRLLPEATEVPPFSLLKYIFIKDLLFTAYHFLVWFGLMQGLHWTHLPWCCQGSVLTLQVLATVRQAKLTGPLLTAATWRWVLHSTPSHLSNINFPAWGKHPAFTVKQVCLKSVPTCKSLPSETFNKRLKLKVFEPGKSKQLNFYSWSFTYASKCSQQNADFQLSCI